MSTNVYESASNLASSIKNWTVESANTIKDWTVEHKQELLTCAKVAAIALAVLGAYLAVSALATQPLLTMIETYTFNWNCYASETTLTTSYTLAKGLFEGLAVLAAGLCIYTLADRATEAR
jgi:hypothetical protein